ncbi:tetraspanin-9-like [Symsagittifera roscoffensis]|uniref:tetraspanin-9-like n=1 Tax=Symsagittifera roscoffensis TaxID=84072 RepID=UPI00307C7402
MDVTKGISYALFSTSMVVALCGLGGTVLNNKTMLFIYGMVLLILLLGYVIMLVTSMAVFGYAASDVNEFLNTTMNNYEGEAGSNYQSKSWNVVQLKFNVCGISNYTDWKKSTFYENGTQILKLKGGKTNTTQSNITQFFPLTCCKDIEQFITVTDINKNAVNVSKVPYDFAEKCYNKASPHVNEKGARDDVKGLLITLLILSLIGMLIVIGIQVFLVWAAFKVYNSI